MQPLQASTLSQLSMQHAASHSMSSGSSSAMDCVTSKSTDDEVLPADPDESSASIRRMAEKYASKATGVRLKKVNRPIKGRPESSTGDLHKLVAEYCVTNRFYNVVEMSSSSL